MRTLAIRLTIATVYSALALGACTSSDGDAFNKVVLTEQEEKLIAAGDNSIVAKFQLPVGASGAETGLLRIPKTNEASRYVIHPKVVGNSRLKQFYYVAGLVVELGGVKNPTPDQLLELYAVDYNYLVYLAKQAERGDFKQRNTPGKVWGDSRKPASFSDRFEVLLPRGPAGSNRIAVLHMPKAGFHLQRYTDPRVKENGASLPAVTLENFVESVAGKPMTFDSALDLALVDSTFLMGMYKKLTLEATTDFGVKCFNDPRAENGTSIDLDVRQLFPEPLTATEFPFTLKTGYTGATGEAQTEGALRVPLLRDEVMAVDLPKKVEGDEKKKDDKGGWAKGYGNYEVLDGSSRDRGSGPVFDLDKVIARTIIKLGNMGKLEYSQLRGLTGEDRKIIKEAFKASRRPPDVKWICPGKPPEAEGQDPIPEQEREMNFEDLMKRYGYIQ